MGYVVELLARVAEAVGVPQEHLRSTVLGIVISSLLAALIVTLGKLAYAPAPAAVANPQQHQRNKSGKQQQTAGPSKGERESHHDDDDNDSDADNDDDNGTQLVRFVEGEDEFIPLDHKAYSQQEMSKRSREFYQLCNRRRTVRQFSSRPVPRDVLENIVHTAGTSPSGAHCQPWYFCVITDPDMKKQIRAIVEEEEEINYKRRMGGKWVDDLKPLKTDWNKPYIEEAPAIIIALDQKHGYGEDGKRQVHYYHELSSGIACGLLVTAIHYAGLATVTSTPLNAGPKLRKLLNRPSNEKVLLLLPVGYPSEDCTVPNLKRKALDEIMTFY